MNSNTCVMCGADIPEGRQVCYTCENRVYSDVRENVRKHASFWRRIIGAFKQKTV